MYLPPFVRFQKTFVMSSGRGVQTATIPVDSLKGMVRALLGHIPVDEAWYLDRYPDVGGAIRSGVFKSARSHFIAEGYFEGRWPSAIQVDEVWYLAQYPEVAAAVKSGIVKSAQQHFEENGYREGRLPGPEVS